MGLPLLNPPTPLNGGLRPPPRPLNFSFLYFVPPPPTSQTANGNVEAKVVCLFRRRDISSSLNSLADSNARECYSFWGGGGGLQFCPPLFFFLLHVLWGRFYCCVCASPPPKPNVLFSGPEDVIVGGAHGLPPPPPNLLILVWGGGSLSLGVMAGREGRGGARCLWGRGGRSPTPGCI